VFICAYTHTQQLAGGRFFSKFFPWGPCAGTVNEILLEMIAKTEPLHERDRCRIESRNGATSIWSDAKSSPKVWQLQFHVNKTAKDGSPVAMRVSHGCTFGQSTSKIVALTCARKSDMSGGRVLHPITARRVFWQKRSIW